MSPGLEEPSLYSGEVEVGKVTLSTPIPGKTREHDTGHILPTYHLSKPHDSPLSPSLFYLVKIKHPDPPYPQSKEPTST
jgi:hypothetical protein